MASLGVHAEELPRRISEIDLTALRHRANTQTESQLPSATKELPQAQVDNDSHDLNGHDERDNHDNHPPATDGAKTPCDLPAPPPSTPNPEPVTHEEPVAVAEPNTDAAREEEAKKKKKKKKKSSGKNKKAAPTGFEEFYADPPITPDENEEENELYCLLRPFAERIQTCIQRYRKRRNLDNTRANILTKFLMLGGVDSSTTKQFTGGLDKETLENSTAKEIAAIQATDFIRSGTSNAKYFDRSNPEGWVVDFEGVAKGFLSCTAPKRLPSETEKEIKTYCAVVKNFLNYILIHVVCAEYEKDVLAARGVCDLAEKELWDIRQARTKFPGEFNVAASTLYGGLYRDLLPKDGGWGAGDSESNEQELAELGADRIFKTAIAFEGSEELFLEALKGGIHIVKTETRFVEVVHIDRATEDKIRDYSRVKNHLGVAGTINALGKIQFKPWDGPGFDEEDTSDDESEEVSTSTTDPIIETFWLEDHILNHCFIGMKLEVDVQELNIGVKFLDQVPAIYCSFHTVPLNEKVIDHWKEPAPNPRPPPTEDDPDVEEGALGAEMERELEEDEKCAGGKKVEIAVSDSQLPKV